jgi:transmembrane sensor
MTKHHPFQCHEDILEEARVWVIKFNADAPISGADVQAMQAWAKRSPAHRAALAEAEAFWCEAELLSQLAVPLQRKSDGGLGSFFSVLASALTAMGRSGAVAASLVLGLGLTLGVLWLPTVGSVGNGIYHTAIGEQKTLRLHDDSVVHLDTGSQVRIDYQDNTRQIYLLQGKAHFDVAKNPDRPFEVFARDGLVRAVGTAFSVYLTSEEVEVIVDEGRVDLARLGDIQSPSGAESSSEIATLPSDEQKALVASTVPANAPLNQSLVSVQRQVFLSLDRGQGARFNRERHELAELGGQALAQQLSWRDGVLVFVRDPLHEIVSEVSRYTHTTIDIADPALADVMMGGRFRVGELDALFEVLVVGFGVEVSYLSEHHVQLRRATQ